MALPHIHLKIQHHFHVINRFIFCVVLHTKDDTKSSFHVQEGQVRVGQGRVCGQPVSTGGRFCEKVTDLNALVRRAMHGGPGFPSVPGSSCTLDDTPFQL